MKYVIIRCEDTAQAGGEIASLLEGAKTAHLQQLAQAGAAGLIRPKGTDALDHLQIHRGLFSLSPQEHDAAPGHCYAASANIAPAHNATVWCCEFVTHHEGRIIDPTAGHIPTKESRVLLQALNEQLGSEGRRWETGDASHHLLVVHDPALGINGFAPVPSPETLVGQPWKHHLPKGALHEPLQRLIEQAAKVLEHHAVNRVRVDLGENPANMVWLWGASAQGAGRSFKDRSGLSAALVSRHFPMKGFAQALGLQWQEGPKALEEEPLRRLMKTVTELIAQHDLVYVHLRVESRDPVERLCAMERIDQLVLKPLTETLPRHGAWRLLAVVDDRAGAVPFVAMGTGVSGPAVSRLNSQTLAESSLAFADSTALHTWFMNE